MDTASLKMLENLKTLEAITLEGNPWVCDCQAKEFLTFLQGNFKKVKEKKQNIISETCFQTRHNLT